MKKFILVCLSFILAGCATGVGKKMSQETIDQIRTGKGRMTKTDVRKKIGAAPQTQLERDGLQCDSYAYSGYTNYFLFTTTDKSQSYNFCYDSKTEVLTKVDGMQM